MQLLWNKLDDRKFQMCRQFCVAVIRWKVANVSRTEGVCHVILFAPHHPWAAPKRPILNRVKSCKKVMEFFFSNVAGYNLIKKGLHQRFFPVKVVKLFRAVFNQGNFWQMILYLLGLMRFYRCSQRNVSISSITQWQLTLRNLIKTMILVAC